MTLAIAILMKDPSLSKTRLRPMLDCDVRAQLALTMFENTLHFLRTVRPDAPIAVVSASPRIARIALDAGLHHVAEEVGGGINAAAALAADWAAGAGAGSLLVLHADIPTLVAEEFDTLERAAEEHPVVIARSRDGGSNAVLLTPPRAIRFGFGPDLAAVHARAAHAAGLGCAVLDMRHLGQDLDTPDDLISLRRRNRPQFGAFAVQGLPEFAAGDDLPAAVLAALDRMGEGLVPGDIVVIAQKVVSKAEGRLRRLDSYVPSPAAMTIAGEIGKDPRKVEAILRESSEVLRKVRQPPDGLLITRHRRGWICANAGIDESNLGPERKGHLLLLPEDPDRSARNAADMFGKAAGGPVGVVISDTFGRPWRHGLTNIAIGVAVVPAVIDWSGKPDASGRMLKSTISAFADEIASSAGLLTPKDAQTPVAILRGLPWDAVPHSTGQDLLRPFSKELFT